MFTTFVVQPIFNLLVFIYGTIPGHNFGIALILFTIVIRLCMWPLVKRQLRQTKVMRTLQPELKRIKKEARGDRQKESLMMMELYKERGVNPFGTIPVLIVQMIVLFGLYAGLLKVIKDPHQIINFAYAPLQHLPWLEHLSHNIKAFDNSLFGLVDLSRPALSPKGIYVPALVLVIGSAFIQFMTSRQLMPNDQDARKLRHILKAAGDGQQADQAEVNAAVSRSMQYAIPVMVFLFTVNIAAALSLYWLVGGIVAYIQQSVALREDETDLERLANGSVVTVKNSADIPEAEIITTNQQRMKTKKQTRPSKRKRR